MPISPGLLDSASWWFNFSWYGLLIAGVITAFGACGTVAFLFVQFWSSGVKEAHLEWRTSEIELEAKRITGEIEQAKADVIVANERIATANAAIAKSGEHAAVLENETAKARLEQERLKDLVSWRVIDPAILTVLAMSLSRSEGQVTLRYVATDAEAVSMAVQISRAFAEANRLAGKQIWTLLADPHLYANRLVFLTHIPDLGTEDSRAVRASFSEANIAYLPDDVTEEPATGGAVIGGVSFGMSMRQSKALIIIGSKPPPF